MNSANEQDDVALKPCPFCGGEACHSIGERNAMSGGTPKKMHYVECLKCEATASMTDSKVESALAWNQRAYEARK